MCCLRAVQIVCLWVVPVISGYRYENELDLRAAMFANYSDSIRPVMNQSNTVDVSLTLELLNIESMDITKQTLTLTIWTIVNWKDEMMVWDKAIFGGADRFYVHSGDDMDIWKPDILVTNTIGDFKRIGTSELPTTVHSDGEVTLEMGMSVSTHCDADITYYPFDTQTCDLILGALVYSLEEVNMTLNKIITKNYRRNGEWELLNFTGSRQEITYDVEPEAVICFTLKLKRLRPFFIMNLIAPLILLSSLNVVVFALPVESGEKVGLSITSLLSFAVFLSVIGNSLPNTSQNMPVIGVYVLVTFISSVFSVCITVIILNCHARQGSPVPTLLKNFTCGCLSKIVCVRIKECTLCSGESEVVTMKAPSHVSMKKPNIQMKRSSHSGSQIGVIQDGGHTTGNAREETSFSNSATEDHDIDWHGVVKVLDRSFLWLFLLQSTLTWLVVVSLWVSN